MTGEGVLARSEATRRSVFTGRSTSETDPYVTGVRRFLGMTGLRRGEGAPPYALSVGSPALNYSLTRILKVAARYYIMI
jgi:hypothetical protein